MLVPNKDMWKATELNVDGYMGVYFIMLCEDYRKMCIENNVNEVPPRYNLSFYSYYFD